MAKTKGRRPSQEEKLSKFLDEVFLRMFVDIHSQVNFKSYKRKITISIFLAAFIILGAFLGSLLQSTIINSIDDFSHRNWLSMVGHIIFLICSVLVLLPIRGLIARHMAMPDKTQRLRTMLTNKEVPLPLALEQPSELKRDEIPLQPTIISPIKHWKGKAILTSIFGSIFFLLAIGIPVGIIILNIFTNFLFLTKTLPDFIDAIFIILFSCMFIPLMGFIGYSSFLSAWQTPDGSRAIINDWELQWRQSGWFRKRYVHVPWHEVLGFYCITYWGNNKLYLLHGTNASLLWKTTDRSKRKELEANQLLASLIVNYTRQPLYDLSSAITSESQSRDQLERVF